ncbi:MAG TPA: Yip1 family protein [Allosphingosinicella sp.]|jgi:hypothetical protein
MATNPTGGTSVNLVNRARNIIMRPKLEWPVIDAEPSTIADIYRSYVVVLAAIPPIASAIGQLAFGFRLFGLVYRPSPVHVISDAIIRYLLSLAMVYVLALIIEALAPTFGGTKDRVAAFKVAAYGSTAGWLAGIFGIIPNLAILGIVGLYSVYLYYTGLPILMKVAADKAIGYVLAVIVAAIILWIVVGVITAAAVGAFAPIPTAPGGSISFG